MDFSLKRDWPAVLVATAIAVLLAFYADYRVHVRDAEGVVLSANVPPQEPPPLRAYAQVRLEDGRVISAWVVSGSLPNRGDTASVRIYRGAITGRAAYEILQTSRPTRPN